jgi:hypothetical protein
MKQTDIRVNYELTGMNPYSELTKHYLLRMRGQSFERLRKHCADMKEGMGEVRAERGDVDITEEKLKQETREEAEKTREECFDYEQQT